MFTIKVVFKGKVFMLAKGIKSIDQIMKEIKGRFPNQCQNGLILKHQDRELKKFQEVLNIVEENSLNKIKIQVHAREFQQFSKEEQGRNSEEEQKMSERQLLQYESDTSTNQFKDIEDLQVKKQESKNESEADNEFAELIPSKQMKDKEWQQLYKCFYCEGEGCKVCSGKGMFTEQSSFIKKIDKIISHRIQIKSKRSQEQKQQQQLVKVQVKSSKFNKKRTNISSQFRYGYTVQVLQYNKNIKQSYVYDVQTKRVMSIKLKKGINNISVGPFYEKKQGNFHKEFKLFYFNQQSQMIFFGPQFQLNIQVVDWNKKKRQLNKYQEYIEKLHKKHNVKISVEGLIEKIRDMGINDGNFEQNKELVQDIVGQL